MADCNLLKFSLRERPVAREQRKLAAILAADVVGYASAITMKFMKPLYGSSKVPELSRKTKSPNTVTVLAVTVVSRSISSSKI